MKLIVYALCGNEEKMLPWFLRYYKEAGAEKIVVYLNSTSKDGSRSILEQCPIVELHEYDTGGVLRDDIHREMKNTIWKQDKFGPEDWAIVVDCDEFVVGNPAALWDMLVDLAKKNVTLPLTHGYNILGDHILNETCFKTGRQIYDILPMGISTEASGATCFGKEQYPHGAYHKPCAFRPAFVTETNYDAGCHHAKAKGTVESGKETKLWLLHAKWAFGVDYVLNRPFNLSEENKQHRWGISFLDKTFIREYHHWALKNRKKLFHRTVHIPGTPHPIFTQDWFSNRIPQWLEWFAPYKDVPSKALEIGVFEGQSSLWLLENILTAYESRLVAVDTFQGAEDQVKAGIYLKDMLPRYQNNIHRYKEKVRIYAEPSISAMPKLVGNFDFIYVDGSHTAADVFMDAAQAWRLLRVGGTLVFDDYAWRQEKDPVQCPYPAIDGFLYCFQGHYERLPSGLLPQPDLQVAVLKTHE